MAPHRHRADMAPHRHRADMAPHPHRADMAPHPHLVDTEHLGLPADTGHHRHLQREGMVNRQTCFIGNEVGMKKVLLAVDDTKGSKPALETYIRVFPCVRPETTVLLYVEKFEGRSLMDEMLPDSEIITLREVLHGTEFQEALDRKAQTILNYYRTELENAGVTGIKPVIRSGQPAEEILGAAKEEGVEMIIIGSRGRRVSHLFMGSVSREVANNAEVPVLLAR